jgi:lipoprotein-releasing system ATP-binding protein
MNNPASRTGAHQVPLVQVKDLHKVFHLGNQEVEVLRGVNLNVDRGEILAIVGASGAGKSTLLHIMGTLDRPTKGAILYEGQDLQSLSEPALAEFRNRRIGFVFQFHHLLPEFTALENTYLPALIQKQPKAQAIDAAKRILSDVGLAHRYHHKPGELSGGEQQRVAVARALIRNPELILADEPTGNLDTHTGGALFDLLRNLNQKHSIAFVIVTHNERLSAQTDRLIHLEDGLITLDRQLGEANHNS